MTEQQADIRARITALRAMRQLARQHGASCSGATCSHTPDCAAV